MSTHVSTAGTGMAVFSRRWVRAFDQPSGITMDRTVSMQPTFEALQGHTTAAVRHIHMKEVVDQSRHILLQRPVTGRPPPSVGPSDTAATIPRPSASPVAAPDGPGRSGRRQRALDAYHAVLRARLRGAQSHSGECAINQSQPFFCSLCVTFVIVRNLKHFLL